MARDINEEIEALSEERQRLWAEGAGTEATKAISKKIDGLYDDKRTAVAAYGGKAARERAKKRAKAEEEIDRLMGVR